MLVLCRMSPHSFATSCSLLFVLGWLLACKDVQYWLQGKGWRENIEGNESWTDWISQCQNHAVDLLLQICRQKKEPIADSIWPEDVYTEDCKLVLQFRYLVLFCFYFFFLFFSFFFFFSPRSLSLQCMFFIPCEIPARTIEKQIIQARDPHNPVKLRWEALMPFVLKMLFVLAIC